MNHIAVNAFLISLMVFNGIVISKGNAKKSQDSFVSFLYKLPIYRIITGSKWPSVFAGAWANSRISRMFIKGFVRKHEINMNESLHPADSFKNFNHFFIRQLKEGARPIASGKHHIVSPADSDVLVMTEIGSHSEFPIKGSKLDLLKLFGGDKELAKEFEGGTLFVFRLSPWHYHRFHAPVAGAVIDLKVIKGKYDSVNHAVFSKKIQPLETNERHLMLMDSHHFGNVAVIPVGALFVGSIVETYSAGRTLDKGAELGYFLFGGSTVVVVFKKGAIIPDELMVENSVNGKETPIKMGELIGKKSF